MTSGESHVRAKLERGSQEEVVLYQTRKFSRRLSATQPEDILRPSATFWFKAIVQHEPSNQFSLLFIFLLFLTSTR